MFLVVMTLMACGKQQAPNGGVRVATELHSPQGINSPPVAIDASFYTGVNQPKEILLVASDFDVDDLTYEIVTAPLHGKVEKDGGSYLYIPDSGFEGTDSLVFKASDGKDFSNRATILIHVD